MKTLLVVCLTTLQTLAGNFSIQPNKGLQDLHHYNATRVDI